MKSLRNTILESLNENKLPKLKVDDKITWEENGKTIKGTVQTIKRDKYHIKPEAGDLESAFDFIHGDDFHKKIIK